jgi:chromate transporter
LNQPVSLKQLSMYFLKLGATGFGGPAALVGYMQRDLVEERKWITHEEYVEGFALAQLSPGPLAAQLAIYLGWVRGGILGATLVGGAFVLPSFLMCVVLAYAYIHFGALPWIQSLFYTIGAAVIGIIINSTFKLVKKTVGKDKVLLAIWIVSAIATAVYETEFLWLFLIAGFLNVVIKIPPSRSSTAFAIWPISLTTGLLGEADQNSLTQIFLFFAKAGTFVFGSGLAIVPFLHSGVVQEHNWLTERQFLDAVAVAMITPGPVVITVAFIGCLVAGFAGGLVAAAGTFLPCYLLTVIPAPHFHKIQKYKRIKIFVEGLTAAAIGAIGGACWVLGKKAIIDVPTAVIAVVALLLLLKTKIPEPLLILSAGLLGIAIYGFR